MRRKCCSCFWLLRGQMSDWLHSSRTWIMGLVLLTLTYLFVSGFKENLRMDRLYAYAGETLYKYLSLGFGNILLSSAMFLIMVSEVPRRIAFQNDMLIRASRAKWLRAQVLFCLAIVACMIALMTIFSMLLTLPVLSPGRGWSDLARIAADPDAMYEPQFVPAYIRAIPPWQASLLSVIILFAFWFTMVLVILMFSLAGKPNHGLMLYVFLLVLDITLMWELIPGVHLPSHFATLGQISAHFPERELQVAATALCAYAGIDLAMIGVMHLQVRKMDMRFTGKD